MSDTDTGITGSASDGDRGIDSGAKHTSVVKARMVSTGIAFAALADGDVSVSAHDDKTRVAFTIPTEDAARLARELAAIVSGATL